MGGYFGVVSKKNVMIDVFFGTDYHSHLGTKSGGIAVYDKEFGIQRKIHNISNSPFRTKFEHVFEEMQGTSAIGCINDSDPQPLLVKSKLGFYAIAFTGVINNAEKLIEKYIQSNCGQFGGHSGGVVNQAELAAAFINQKSTFTEGIEYLFSEIEGTATVLILKEDGNIICARDKNGRLPVHLGKNNDGVCISFESFAYQKLGYKDIYELGPNEIVEVSTEGYNVLRKAGDKMCMCSFLWSYYGYPTSTYEDVNVEEMRYKNGEIMAENDIKNGTMPNVDCVAGVPDSGTPHAIGYANKSQKRFARPFIKYTPTWARSFMPSTQKERKKVAKLKLVPVKELIKNKNLLFVDDSIVRGTQIRETVDFLYENGAKSVHIRSACPPIMYGCKYLNFSRQTSDTELITRATILELEGEEGLKHIAEYADSSTERHQKMKKCIQEKLHLASLEFQTLDGLLDAIGIDKCKLCTYCWNGKE